MMPDPVPDMLTAALDAYDNGICVVRARTDGSKRPVGEWKQYQAQRPSREQVVAWFSDGHAGMGAICGAVSGDLEMFELEGRFVDEIGTGDFVERMKAAGHELLMKRLLAGIVVESPSGGRHLLYRCSDAPIDGNTKLASRPATDAELAAKPGDTVKVLIETRGEGGFVVLPPSHGTVHPSGKAWQRRLGTFASIATITAEEREAMFAVARSYDQTPQPSPPTPVAAAQRVAQPRYTGSSVGPSWYDAVVDHVATVWTMQALLEKYGWDKLYEDAHGRTLMHRPGKDDAEAVGGSINTAGRFHPFSSSTPFPNASANKQSPTYDHLDVIAWYEYAGDRDHAARTIAEATGIMKAWQRERDDELAASIGYTPPAGPQPNVDPETGETRPSVPTIDIWDERPILAHIRDAARNRMVSPWAVLGCVLARVAAFTPPSTCLPALIGGTSPLSLYIALYGSSGAGKSAPTQCAADLLPDIPAGCIGPIGLGSGEGLIEAYMELVEETDGGGKTKKVKRQIKRGALFTLDEGQALTEMGSRKGSTILPVLRTAWSGGDPGQANATVETRRTLRPNTYAVGLVSLWQDKAASILLADVDGGTPQRFVWLPTTDPEASRDRPRWPGTIAWEPPPAIAIGGVMQPYPLDVDPVIEDEILDARVMALHGTLAEDPLDAHRRLNKLKVAGVLCVLDGRTGITVDDWWLAERILGLSDDVRGWITAEAARRNADTLAAEASRAVYREAVVEKSAAERALKRAAKAAWRVVAKGAGEPVGRRLITQGVASRDRQHVTVDDAIAEAERLEWIVSVADSGWIEGEAKPA